MCPTKLHKIPGEKWNLCEISMEYNFDQSAAVVQQTNSTTNSTGLNEKYSINSK